MFKQVAEFASSERFLGDESQFDPTGEMFALHVTYEPKNSDGSYPKRVHFIDFQSGTLLHSQPRKPLTKTQWTAKSELLIHPSQEETHPAYEVTAISPKLKTSKIVLKQDWRILDRTEHGHSPCGRWFIVARGGRIEVFEVGAGRLRGAIDLDRKFHLYTLSHRRIAFSRDGERLFVGEAFPDADERSGRGLLVYDVKTLKLVQRISMEPFFGYVGGIRDVGGGELLLRPCRDAEDFIEGDRAWVSMNLQSGMVHHFAGDAATEVEEYCNGWYVRSPPASKNPTTRVVNRMGEAVLTVRDAECHQAQFAGAAERLLLTTMTNDELYNLECRLLRLPDGKILWAKSKRHVAGQIEPIFSWRVRISNDGKRLADVASDPKGVVVRFWEDR